jgi:hypothetical protein
LQSYWIPGKTDDNIFMARDRNYPQQQTFLRMNHLPVDNKCRLQLQNLSQNKD